MNSATDAALVLVRLGVLAVLYLFLAVVIRVAWRDVSVAVPARQSAIGRAYLVVVEAPPGLFRAGQRFPIEGIASVGRDSDNQIVVPDRTVSGRHAALWFRDAHWWVEDLGSTNGTYVNNRQVTGPQPVEAGDVLQFGRAAFQLAR